MDEWNDLGRRLLEANPERYRQIRTLLRQLAKAEEQIASPDLRIIVDMMRAKALLTGT